MSKIRVWWESLSLMEKVNIIDYKVTQYGWDSLNKIDHEIIKKHYLNSKQTVTLMGSALSKE